MAKVTQSQEDKEIRKQLENLFSWSELYSKNQNWDAYNKCEIQILEFKQKHNLN